MWIEISPKFNSLLTSASLPLRECGLKFFTSHSLYHLHFVTPLAGVWIEILVQLWDVLEPFVTPLAGVWIEIPAMIDDFTDGSGHSPCGSVD